MEYEYFCKIFREIFRAILLLNVRMIVAASRNVASVVEGLFIGIATAECYILFIIMSKQNFFVAIAMKISTLVPPELV